MYALNHMKILFHRSFLFFPLIVEACLKVLHMVEDSMNKENSPGQSHERCFVPLVVIPCGASRAWNF